MVEPALPDVRPVVLDGGLATELEARGHDLSGALWSARLLADAPEAVVAAHRAFFAAGADVATTASYQASFPGLAAAGIDPEAAARLLRRSVGLARTAVTELERSAFNRSQLERSGLERPGLERPGPERPGPGPGRRSGTAAGRRRWVAASVGPYGAALADGSEYRGRYGLGVAELADWHRPRLEVLAAAGPDLLACETIPDAVEAEALVAALDGLGVPAWLTYSVAGSRTRAGQPLTEAFAVVADAAAVGAVGVNCCDPADVGPAIATARAVTGKPVVVYPNSGEVWDAATRRWTGRSRFTPAAAAGWVAQGAAAVGGCCRVRPSDIAAVSRAVRSASGPASG